MSRSEPAPAKYEAQNDLLSNKSNSKTISYAQALICQNTPSHPPRRNKSSVICRYLFETLSFFPALQVGVDAGWRQARAAVMTLKLLLVDIYSTQGQLWGSTHDHIGFVHVGVQLLVARLPQCFQVPVCSPDTRTHTTRKH